MGKLVAVKTTLITILRKMIYDLTNVVIKVMGFLRFGKHGGIIEQAKNSAR